MTPYAAGRSPARRPSRSPGPSSSSLRLESSAAVGHRLGELRARTGLRHLEGVPRIVNRRRRDSRARRTSALALALAGMSLAAGCGGGEEVAPAPGWPAPNPSRRASRPSRGPATTSPTLLRVCLSQGRLQLEPGHGGPVAAGRDRRQDAEDPAEQGGTRSGHEAGNRRGAHLRPRRSQHGEGDPRAPVRGALPDRGGCGGRLHDRRSQADVDTCHIRQIFDSFQLNG